MNLVTKNPNPNSEFNVRERRAESGNVVFLDVEVIFSEPTVPKPVSVKLNFPCKDIYSVFSPTIWSARYLGPNWQRRATSSRLSSGLPVHSLLSLGGQNRLTVAISDACTASEISSGVVEEDGSCELAVSFFTRPTDAIDGYRATVRLDFSDVRYESAVREAERWWREECGYKPAPVPEHARMPMYSTWYSFHQGVSPEAITEQCRLAKRLGMESVIVDDGWQTDDGSRGYAFCGDWEAAKSKVPDMKGFVDAVHACGMKFLMWFGMPFVGVHSRAYKRFEGKYLGTEYKNGEATFSVLDPRFPEVREYLVKLYARAVGEWGADGLKLDFIDSFRLYPDTPAEAEGRDIFALDDAVERLMSDVYRTLTEIRSDIMLEFRQTYVGPAIRRYGNMLRVRDCPLDALINRYASVELRLVSGETAVHSDMLTWNYDDSAESAAIQMISALFCVPQISVRLDEIPESHLKMLEFYLGFWRKNRDVLIDGELRAENPEAFYTLVSSRKDGTLAAVCYVDTVLKVGAADRIYYINGSASDTLIVSLSEPLGERTVTVYSCTGDTVRRERLGLGGGLHGFAVPRGGMLAIEA